MKSNREVKKQTPMDASIINQPRLAQSIISTAEIIILLLFSSAVNAGSFYVYTPRDSNPLNSKSGGNFVTMEEAAQWAFDNMDESFINPYSTYRAVGVVAVTLPNEGLYKSCTSSSRAPNPPTSPTPGVFGQFRNYNELGWGWAYETSQSGSSTTIWAYSEICYQPGYSPAKQPLDSCEPVAGDPIMVATGNSFQTERDYQSESPFGLNFIRYYNSGASLAHTDFGIKWRNSLNRRVSLSATNSNVAAYRGNGQVFSFNYDGANWQGDVDIPDTLVETVDGNNVRTGWEYRDSADTVETYNATGQLLSITNRAGQSQTLAYDIPVIDGGDDNNSTLDKVTGYTGDELLFSYDSSQRISTMTDPEGNVYSYSYDAIGNLSSVTYPDDTPLDNSDNPVRTYHYENTTYPHHLTGLTDETGSRVTWAFDSQGRAISSELDGGVDKSTLDFSVADQVTVTNPLGKDTTYHFTTLHGVKKVTQVEGHATASCAGANQNYTYDANGYMASKTDWQGNVTSYVHDARGLETSRTEASGTPEARTITTTWHSDFRLPTQITEPGKVITFTYDAQGRQLTQTVSSP